MREDGLQLNIRFATVIDFTGVALLLGRKSSVDRCGTLSAYISHEDTAHDASLDYCSAHPSFFVGTLLYGRASQALSVKAD